MKVNRFWFLFEQTGTFKAVAQKLGYSAFDVDIVPSPTVDYCLDLFKEIDSAMLGSPCIFDNIDREDLVLAFFPCVRFSDLWRFHIIGKVSQVRNSNKYLYSMKCFDQTALFFGYYCKLCHVCRSRGLRLIVENPSSGHSILKTYAVADYKLFDDDRSVHGDYFTKPTVYLFHGCEPSNTVLFVPSRLPSKTIEQTLRGIERSRIAPEYAEWFLRSVVLGQGGIL